MSFQLLVATLSITSDKAPSIRFRRVDFDTSQTHEHHGILGFYLIAEDSTVEVPKDYQKRFLKGKKCSARFSCLLNGSQGWESVRGCDPFLRLHDQAFVGGPPAEGHARSIEGISSFQKMDFIFPSTGSRSTHDFLRSTQYLHVSAPTLKDEVLFAGSGTLFYDHVELLSGVCLFSMKILQRSFSNEGRPYTHELIHAKPTLYEMEFMSRASTTLADVASLIVLKNREQSQNADKTSVGITLDIPSFHYYYTVAHKLEQGLCTAKQALEWFEAIEYRHDQVFQVFQTMIRIALTKRGVLHTECAVRCSPKNNSVSSYIRRALSEGTTPELNVVLAILDKDEDSTWNVFYNLVQEKDRPRDFRALGYLFHVFQIVRYGIQPNICSDLPRKIEEADTARQSSSGFRARRLLISVDDRVERKIYSRSQTLLKKFRQGPDVSVASTLVEIYSCKRVFINNNESGGDLYQDDPAPMVPTITFPGSEKEGVPCRASSSIRMEPEEMVSYLHGTDFKPRPQYHSTGARRHHLRKSADIKIGSSFLPIGRDLGRGSRKWSL